MSNSRIRNFSFLAPQRPQASPPPAIDPLEQNNPCLQAAGESSHAPSQTTLNPFSKTPSVITPSLRSPKYDLASHFRGSKLGTQVSKLPVAAFADGPGRVRRAFANDVQTREQQALEILSAQGLSPKEGRIYVIQIDQDSPSKGDGKDAITHYLQSYTGQMAVFEATAAADGQVSLTELGDTPLRSAAHPRERTTERYTANMDVNRDGKADVAHLNTGVYRYAAKRLHYGGRGAFAPARGQHMRVTRDRNHNGVIDGYERGHRRGRFATGLFIHPGKDDTPSSLGCQTLPPKDFAELHRMITDADVKEFSYIMVRRPNDVYGSNPKP